MRVGISILGGEVGGSGRGGRVRGGICGGLGSCGRPFGFSGC